jgi:predicted O-methyltransferase YrrM
MAAAIMTWPSGLDEPQAKAVLTRLHRAARRDVLIFARAFPALVLARLRGVPLAKAITPHLAGAYLPLSPVAGRFLYLTARAIDARRAVEFGTSFGVSAIYLASAMRDTGGSFIGSEKEPAKATAARRNLT